MSSLEIALAPLAAVACLLSYVWLLKKFPSGVVFLGFTSYGIAWVSFAGVNYARIVFALQLISAVVFAYSIFKTKGFDRVLAFLTSKYGLFLWFILLLWVKIAFDIMYGGINEFRSDALKMAVQTVFLPATVFFCAAVGSDPWRFAAGIMVGMVLFAVAFVGPAVPAMIVEGKILSALVGADRLTVYNMDTINGGRFFFIGAVGALTLWSAGGLPRWVSTLLVVLTVAFSILLLLNGTRQFILGGMVAALMCFYSMFRSRGFVRVIIFFGIVGAMGYFAYSIFQTAEIGQRFSSVGIAQELSFSRGQIWQRVFHEGLERPLVGEGFRNFGDVVMVASQGGEDEQVATLSGAHGFFQDVWVEHGAVWGAMAFLLFVFCLHQILRRIKLEQHSVIWAHFCALTALVVPLFMSGAFFDSGAMYLLACSMYVAFAKHKIDQAQQHVIRVETLRAEEARRKQKAIIEGKA